MSTLQITKLTVDLHYCSVSTFIPYSPITLYSQHKNVKCPEGREFESLLRILDGHFSQIFVVKL